MNVIVRQPRTMILGLGSFGLRSQVHLWKRIIYAVNLRREKFPFLAPPQEFINFLTLRTLVYPTRVALYRPNLKKWQAISKGKLNYNFINPSLEDLNSIFSETMDRYVLESVVDGEAQPRRSDVFASMVSLRTPLLQQFREALSSLMSDSSIVEPQVAQIHVIVIADITNELDSALLWPTLALLNEALSEFQNSELSVFLKTAVYSPAPLSTGERATAYLTLRELEFFSNWEMVSLLPDFMKELLPNRYWAKYLRRVLFDRCYLMDNIKYRDNRSTSVQDIVVALGNIIEAMVMTDLQQVIRERLEPDIPYTTSLKQSKLAPRGERIATEEYEKSNLLIEGWEYPYEDAKMLYRRGVFNGIGAATIYMPIDELDAWGENQVKQRFFHQYLYVDKKEKLEDRMRVQGEEFIQKRRITPEDIVFWLNKEVFGDGLQFTIDIDHNHELTLSWRKDLLHIEDLYHRYKDWLQAVDDLWSYHHGHALGQLKKKLDDARSRLTGGEIKKKVDALLTGFQHEIFNLLVSDNKGVVDALGLTLAVKEIIDERISSIEDQLTGLRQQESNFREDTGRFNRRRIKETFRSKRKAHSTSMSIAMKLHTFDRKIAQWIHPSNGSPGIFARLGSNFVRGVEKEWLKYYDQTLRGASITLSIGILELLQSELYQALKDSLEKTKLALTEMLKKSNPNIKQTNEEKSNDEQPHRGMKLSDFDLEYIHFLRTSQPPNNKLLDKLFESWSKAIFDSLQRKPLLKSVSQELNKSLNEFFQDLQKDTSKTTPSDYGKKWAELFHKGMEERIQRYAGRWFSDDEFMLEMELIREQKEKDIKQEITLLRRRAQPFIRIESDMFEHEVTALEFITLYSRAQSPYIANFAEEEYQSIVLDSWDPYTITYIQTYHGLNVWILPFVEFYRKEFQILNDADRTRLMLHPEMDNIQYGFAKKVPEIQLRASVFGVTPLWQPPEDKEGRGND